jgi:hypothetical protein
LPSCRSVRRAHDPPAEDRRVRNRQPVYPWRGRITCFPAAGQPGTVDKTAAAGTQVAAFFGACLASHVFVSVNASTRAVTTSYSGPAEWGLRRFILHYAKLCAAVNAIDAFLIGSEFRALCSVRDSATNFPAVARLKTLAADVKGILGGRVKVSYAADWSDYNGYRPADGSNDVFFHLDPLWADGNIDFVGIDWYAPLADWRDGTIQQSSHSANYVDELTRIRFNSAHAWLDIMPLHRTEQSVLGVRKNPPILGVALVPLGPPRPRSARRG